ncbi:gamma-glutamylcyclotransferase [Rosenbergiella epipactidis]|uniref:gamma-glutamylcyclotransferase family protein n=1 Tax=Rosenbergiella epipactidis TaxID=1544694 RepID=UPI00202699F6|nr:gamma-glutamylcyclotransferase [Rosenbergiella epipactidis]MCL9668479.1 gamma-glutamylcyclotransferase [Rosenbergiella epipactidis]
MRIIVYGSLRRKQGNSHWMTNAQWLGDYQVEGYELYNLGHYPGVIPGEGTIEGEVYRIDATTLGELDALRTKGGEYKRQLVSTPYGSAWMYIYQRSVAGRQQIPSGDWLERSENS